MPAKTKKKNSKFGRNIPFGSRSPLKVEQRKAVPDIDTGKMSKTVKSGEQMSKQERVNYVSKVKASLKKKPKSRPVPDKGPGFQPKKHNKYYK
tara:strand:+ start:313 stop:591 length:279 start_codon:yes stop_codon:yes gene_type:complete